MLEKPLGQCSLHCSWSIHPKPNYFLSLDLAFLLIAPIPLITKIQNHKFSLYMSLLLPYDPISSTPAILPTHCSSTKPHLTWTNIHSFTNQTHFHVWNMPFMYTFLLFLKLQFISYQTRDRKRKWPYLI